MYSPLRDWILGKYQGNICIKFLRFQWFFDEYVHDFQKRLDNFFASIVRILFYEVVMSYFMDDYTENPIVWFFLSKKIMKGLRWALVHLLLEGDV